MGKFIDLTGQKFGMLTVLRRADVPGKDPRWVCKCDCGNETVVVGYNLKSGHTSSCGCLRHRPSPNRDSLEGQQFGEWTVLKRVENRPSYWLCQCSCGVIKEVYSSSLKKGLSQSCGHLHRHDAHKPLDGQRFGFLTVIKQIPTDKGQYCICKCDCGNITKVKRANLISGNTKSCGCIVSYGEARIKQLLQENHISFISQYTPKDISNKKYKFDFFVDNAFMIEFDGPQHTGQVGGYYTKERVSEVMRRDMEKNQYCLSHNIPLYRIPYSLRDAITFEDLFNDKFLVKEVDHYHLAQEIETA